LTWINTIKAHQKKARQLLHSVATIQAVGMAERSSKAAKRISIRMYAALWLDTMSIKVGMAHERT